MKFLILKVVFFIPILNFAINICFAQKETSHWYFGYKAGIKFENGDPKAILDGQVYSSVGASSFSDGNGNLLLYTDGDTVYNRMVNLCLMVLN